jgi:CDP-4-dehydro-6-deoxyglucose reductase
VPPQSGWRFQAGQYAQLVLRDGARRCYSMANAPNERGEVEWHIRRIDGGRFSAHAYDALKPRDLLRIEGPFGSFVLRSGTAPVVLLASGTGYAPIASHARYHCSGYPARPALRP